MNNLESAKPIEILLIEDNPGDVRLTKEAFKESKILNNLRVVEDGLKALAFLRQQGDYTSASRPDLILLDLNMPKMDGRQVLAEIKKDPKLKNIPVIILTTSKAEQDILKSYDLHANCYIVKPVDLWQFNTVVQTIKDFWLSIVKLPRSE